MDGGGGGRVNGIGGQGEWTGGGRKGGWSKSQREGFLGPGTVESSQSKLGWCADGLALRTWIP